MRWRNNLPIGKGRQPIFNMDSDHDILLARKFMVQELGEPTVTMPPGMREVIPRNYTTHPVGSMDGIPAAGEKMQSLDILIDPKDFKDQIDRANELQLFPYHYRQRWLPDGGSLKWNQDGLGYCLDAETEILTEEGFVPFPQYDGRSKVATVNQETGVMEYQLPSKVHCYDWDGELIRSKNRRVDFAVTPKHRMYVRKWDESKRKLSDKYSTVNADDMGWYLGLMHAPKPAVGTELVEVEVPGDRMYDGDDYVAMLALIVSDGYAGCHRNRKTRNHVSFCCFNEHRYESVKALADRCGFHEQPSRKGVFQRWDAGALAKHVREECYRGGLGALNKVVPRIVKCASQRQIKLFLTWFGDQDHKHPMRSYYTSSVSLADDLQELLFRIGKRSTPVWRDGRTTKTKEGQLIDGGKACHLVVSSTDRLCLDRKKHLYREHYKGKVYCVTVPNGTMVTRRNGTMLVSNNCWTWGGTGCFMTLRCVLGLSQVFLAPVSMSYLVGGANRGNYLGSWLKGAREKGIVPVQGGETSLEEWPKVSVNSTDRSVSFWGRYDSHRANFRLDEVWDINTRSELQNAQECLTALTMSAPIYIAHNYWSHALQIECMAWDSSAPNNVLWGHLNSHNNNAVLWLEGSKGSPDEAYPFLSAKPTEVE